MGKCHVEVYSRVTGFCRPVQEWNMGKREEFKDRKRYDLSRVSKEKADE
jgi:ribonucleoside-triphosphate reductase (formate)